MELLFDKKAAFETPKPESLMFRIVGIATNPGDLILDSFAGSGTTGAVAHGSIPIMREQLKGKLTVEIGASQLQHWIDGLQVPFCA